MAALAAPWMSSNEATTKPTTLLDSSAFPARTTSLYQYARPSKRLAPGLELRLQRLEEQKRRREAERRRQSSIGRIPEEQLAELERLQDQRVIEVRRRGRAWSGPPVRVMPASGGVRLDGGPMLSEAETSMLESDVSSIISISDRLEPSDTEEEAEVDGLEDRQKYRLPDVGKTRLHLRTKEPLSPTARQVPRSPRRQAKTPTPTTPRSARGSRMMHSPTKVESPRASRNNSVDNITDSDFANSGLSRAGSIYTLGRASFTGQLAQLTGMKLPDASSLAKRISSIPKSKDAAKALSDASEQIRMWVAKASDVLNGLNAEDDVEWAAAGGRDGIEDMDSAISRFDRLVQVYVMSIERLQTRGDVSDLSQDELLMSVRRMESIITSWHKVKKTLGGVKEQVEIAMEWEELWNSVLGEIAQEMEGLNRLVFEMEEKRHQGTGCLLMNGRDSIDLNELETIVEERPGKGPATQNNRFSLPPFSPSSPIQPSPSHENKDDSNLLGLFARMQPLRASLDFLPMRLSVFHCRGNPVFPTACLDLEQRRDQLEAQWKKLEGDAESLRRELGEDRWVLVFRNAGRQALKMCESVGRSYNKLRDGIDTGEQQTNVLAFTKKVENYEAKKMHYGPAIERVLAIIDRGVLDRLTVNGEILRLQSDMKRRWGALQAEMRDMDLVLEDVNSEGREKQLRDSVSTVMSSERSIASSMVDTPGSSPASSILGTSRKSSFQGSSTPTPLTNAKTRQASYTARGSASRSASRAPSSSSIPRRTPLTRTSTSDLRGSPSPSPSSTRISMMPETPVSNRPRWHSAMKTQSRDFLPLSALEPSPYAKAPVTPKTNFLRSSSHSAPAPAASRTQMSRNASTPSSLPKAASISHPSRKSSLPVPTAPTPARASSPLVPKSGSPAFRPSSRMAVGRRSSLLAISAVTDGNEADSESPTHHKSRPPSALAAGRRSSMLPTLSISGLNGLANSVQEENKPRWR
ncbi:hypothetical protein LTR85_001659 [Meristemomyces frigidus]|nr:hypothetical protein LTR85_001659 [Meristemomyces frigidus]